MLSVVFFFQAEDGIRDLVRSRGLGDVYKRQALAALLQRGVAGLRGHTLSRGHFHADRVDGAGKGLSLIHI